MKELSFDRRIGEQDHPKLVAEYGRILAQMTSAGLPTQDQVAALLGKQEPLSDEHMAALGTGDFSNKVFLALFDYKVKVLTFLLKIKKRGHEIPSKIQFPNVADITQHLKNTQKTAVYADRAKTLTQAVHNPGQVVSLYAGRDGDNAILYDPTSQIMGEMERETGEIVGSNILQGYQPNDAKVFSTMHEVFIPVIDQEGALKLVQGSGNHFFSKDRNFNLTVEDVIESGTTSGGLHWYIIHSRSDQGQHCCFEKGYIIPGSEMRVVEGTLLLYIEGTDSFHRQHIFDFETGIEVEIPVRDIEDINLETGIIRLCKPFLQKDWHGETKFRISSESRKKGSFFGPSEYFMHLAHLKEEFQKIAKKEKGAV